MSSRDVFVLRGIPAVGKTKLAEFLHKNFCPSDALDERGKKAVILSTDDFFLQNNSREYIFDKTKIQEAHQWNFERFKKEIEEQTPLIIIDNTNIKRYHFYHYVDWAQRHDYRVTILTIPHNDVSDRELAERSIHGADRGLIRRMRMDFDWKLHD
jgi:predicted kinase